MENPDSPEYLSARQRIRRWKSAAGIFHLLTVAAFCCSLLWAAPRLGAKDSYRLGEEMKERQEARQLLLEALDKYARYEKYYQEINGRFTRDLGRLSLPARFASGRREELQREYEISVLEAHPNRFILLATAVHGSDRVTIDENHRLRANFVLPAPSRAYLVEEADRLLQLRSAGVLPLDGLFGRYWAITASEMPGEFVAQGMRSPVLGEKRVTRGERGIASLFASVSAQVKQRMGSGRAATPSPAEALAATTPGANSRGPSPELEARDVNEWLDAGHLAQHVFRRERGRYAQRWEELDAVSDFGFAERMRVAKNVRVLPIELSGGSYRLLIEGTAGDLLGEQFVVDAAGGVKQVRYTEALINQLQETTSLLENFQINAIVDDAQKRHP